MFIPDQIISLGHNCETKFQISRAQYVKGRPGRTVEDVRDIISEGYGSAVFPRHVFDWQVTPFEALCVYLERHFQGVLEQGDLVVRNGLVLHRDLHTEHPHDFDHGDIEGGYAAGREKFDYLARRFMDHLGQPGRFLYVLNQIQPLHQARRLLDLLSARNPAHQAHLLMVDEPGVDADLGALGARVTKAWRLFANDKPSRYWWEGPDALWDDILRPFLPEAQTP